ncbi:hypothetical protein TNCV_4810861 [Trichonephila clavipes]|nr:hypothetical protein TNCV_4810861 [Trichonephila clavipes]
MLIPLWNPTQANTGSNVSGQPIESLFTECSQTMAIKTQIQLQFSRQLRMPSKQLPRLRYPVVKVSDHGRHVMSSSPVPLKTRRVGPRCTLNLSRAEMFSRWCGS